MEALKHSTRGKSNNQIHLFRIDSAYMRQAVYSTARIGIFLNLTEYIKEKNGGKKASFF
jgi:hypothetical protein